MSRVFSVQMKSAVLRIDRAREKELKLSSILPDCRKCAFQVHWVSGPDLSAGRAGSGLLVAAVGMAPGHLTETTFFPQSHTFFLTMRRTSVSSMLTEGIDGLQRPLTGGNEEDLGASLIPWTL